MKILLINPPIRTWAPPNCFPQGLGYVAQVLRAEHDVGVWDINITREANEPMVYHDIASGYYDAIGITGLITNYGFVKNLIAVVKAHNPKIPIVVGGPLGSSIPEIMLKKARADICVIGEGEVTAIDLFGELEKDDRTITTAGTAYKTVEGNIVWNTERELIQNISELPLPAYDLFPTEIYAKNPCGSTINKAKWTDGKAEKVPKSMNILSSRGCAWRCFFCYHDYMGAKYRYRDANSLFCEIAYLFETYGVKFILMGDDTFVTNKKNVEEFCDLMIFSGMNKVVQWECGARVDTVTKPLLEKMEKAGCVLVGYGVESGSQEMLDRLNKKVKVEQCHKAVEWAQEVFGECEATFIIGTPGETRETIQETIDFCKQHNLDAHAVFYLTPFPKTPLWGWMRQKGYFGSASWKKGFTNRNLNKEEELCLKLSDHEMGETPVINFTGFSDEELIELKENAAQEINAWNAKQNRGVARRG